MESFLRSHRPCQGAHPANTRSRWGGGAVGCWSAIAAVAEGNLFGVWLQSKSSKSVPFKAALVVCTER